MTADKPRRSGWCQSHGRDDSYHKVCAQRLRDGLLDRCDCPEHANDDETDTP